MPPEPSPWDRKDFFKERKLERSTSDSLGPSVPRWRDTTHHHGSPGWGSADLRRPFGHGKQGGWHMLSEEAGSRVDGKYGSNSRESRSSFSGQKDWKGGHSWETTVSPNGNSHPHSDFVNSWDQLQFKDWHDKNGGVSNTGTRVSNAGDQVERENLGSLDWKPLKWARSGSLSSRGSGFSHSNSSKSIGADYVEAKDKAQPSNVTSFEHPSGNINTCATSITVVEETGSRKKPRLGWGEGLAKYEKKKIESPDEGATKSIEGPSVVDDGVSKMVCMYNVVNKSPSITGFSECTSPATPSSVTCSSFSGLDDKLNAKAGTAEKDSSNPTSSPCLLSQNLSEVLAFNLDDQELTHILNLSSSLGELLQSECPNNVDPWFLRSAAMSKVLVWKANISKMLEMTESEIDLLEGELKSLNADTGGSFPSAVAFNSSTALCSVKPSQEHLCDINVNSKPFPLQLNSSGDELEEVARGVLDEENTKVKDEDIDSPGTATSKFVEPFSLMKVVSSDALKDSDCSGYAGVKSENVEVKLSTRGVLAMTNDSDEIITDNNNTPISTDSGIDCDRESKFYVSILASNRDSAERACKVFDKLLPNDQSCIDFSKGGTCRQNDMVIKDIIAVRKHFLKFKERIMTFKFRAFQHLWKEDLCMLSIKRSNAKSQKKLELSVRGENGYLKHRCSTRSRYTFPAGSSVSLVPTKEIVEYAGKLLLDSRAKPSRNSLKMPALILDKREIATSRFISANRLVEDPCTVEKERSMINPWTSQEIEIFLNKLVTHGKDFRKIASFLDHKGTADCVEFYYKNHKSEIFQKARKKPEFSKLGKSHSTTTYLVTSGRRWNRDSNADSLDLLGATASAMAASDSASRFLFGKHIGNQVPPQTHHSILERSRLSSFDRFGNERETAAADVLAGICGSMSSEAMSSCTTSTVEPAEGYYVEWKCQKVGSSSKKRSLPVKVTQNFVDDDETCSDDSGYGELESTNWTDGEKSMFVQALASLGKDFLKISHFVGTRSRDQCKVFYSKARKCLGLDRMYPEHDGEGANNDIEDGGTDSEDACMVENGLDMCKGEEEEEMLLLDLKVENSESVLSGAVNLHPDLNLPEDVKIVEGLSEKLVFEESEPTDKLKFSEEEEWLDKPKLDFFDEKDTVTGSLDKAEAMVDKTADSSASKEVAVQNGDVKYEIIEEPVSAGETGGHRTPLLSGAVVEIKPMTGEIGKNETQLPAGISGFSGNCITMDVLNCSNVAESSCGRKYSLETFAERKNVLELETAPKTCVISSLEHNKQFVASNSIPSADIPLSHHEKSRSHDDSSPKLNFRKSTDGIFQKSASTDGHYHRLPHSLLECVESSPVLRGYPVTVATKKGMNVDVSCNERPGSSLQSIPKLGNTKLRLDHFLPVLQKCCTSKQNGFASELPYMSQEHKPSSWPQSEKPSSSGDVKLFGKILTPSSSLQQKLDSSTNYENEQKLNGGNSGARTVDKQSSNLLKFDHHSHNSNIENSFPLKSYGFWDGNRIQTGFSSLPDSAVLLAKYPAAFGKGGSMAAPKLEHAVEKNLNGSVLVYPTREISSGNLVTDYQSFKNRDGIKIQPFRVDKLRQEILFSEMHRRKEIEVLSSSMQQQGRGGVVGINVVGREGGILVGEPYNGVSDPVAAIKMHYAKAENESWRRGDVGR